MTTTPAGPSLRSTRRGAAGGGRRVYADAVVTTAASIARDRLPIAIGGLGDGAEPGAGDLALRVGPRRQGAPSKQVRARVGPVTDHATTYVQSLQWVPGGWLADWYPSMDGRIGITAVDATTCLLSFAADYVPPLGRLGERLDQYAMSRVAEATARVIADRLARTLSRPEA